TAIVCPAVHYEKTSVQDRFFQREEYEDINWCITSGAITNIPVLKKLGGFDEDMFIDLVDFEYCLRLGESGYRIIRANGFVLKQRLGDLFEKHIGKRRIFVTNHSPMRVYYYSRNLLYCSGKYPEKVGMGFVITDLLKKFIKILLYESDRGDKLKSMFKGIRDGIDMKSMRRN
nr:hypothetical protein [Clostridia bacterium]